MTQPVECQFEEEVLAAALQSRWPDRALPELREHVANCGICSDIAAIGPAMTDVSEEMRGVATVPDSGRVWWLAQVRARREAAATAARPITAAQVLAFACCVGLAGACLGASSLGLQSTLQWLKTSLFSININAIAGSAATLLAGNLLLAVSGAVLLFVVPAAVYFVISRD